MPCVLSFLFASQEHDDTHPKVGKVVLPPCLDADADGFGQFPYGLDCDDSNPAVGVAAEDQCAPGRGTCLDLGIPGPLCASSQAISTAALNRTESVVCGYTLESFDANITTVPNDPAGDRASLYRSFYMVVVLATAACIVMCVLFTWGKASGALLGCVTLRCTDVACDWGVLVLNVRDPAFKMAYTGDYAQLQQAAVAFCVIGTVLFPLDMATQWAASQRAEAAQGPQRYHSPRWQVAGGVAACVVSVVHNLPQLVILWVYCT